MKHYNANVLILVVSLASTCMQLGSASAQEPAWPVYVMNVDGSELSKVAQIDERPYCLAPQFSHDGKKIAFSASERHKGHGTSHIYTCNVDGSELKMLSLGVWQSWSPDDKQLVFHTYDQSPLPTFVMNIDGEGRQQICIGESPRWSPNGELVAIMRPDSTTGRPKLHVYDLVQAEERAVLKTDFDKVNRGFCWSPDNKRLCFAGFKDNAWRLWLLGVEGEAEDLKPLPGNEGGSVSCMSWSPDGKQILIVREASILALDVDGQQPAKEIATPELQPRDPAWSPDGKQIVFIARPLDLAAIGNQPAAPRLEQVDFPLLR